MSPLSTLFLILPLITVVWSSGGMVKDNCTALPAIIGLLPMEGEESLFAADSFDPRLSNTNVTTEVYSKIFSHWTSVKKIFIPLDQRHEKRKLSPSVYKQLAGVDIIVGPYYPVIASYAKMMNIAYILTKPPNLHIERKMTEESNDNRVLFSIWPSWETFYRDSVEAMLDSRKERSEWGIRSLGRVLIIREGLSEDSLEIANLLQTLLLETGRTTRIKMVTLTKKDEEHTLSILKDVVVPIRPHIIVYLYDRQDDLNLLFELYRTIIVEHHMGSYVTQAEWFFWDMTSPYSGLMRKLLTGDGYQMARKFKLRSVGLEPCVPFDHIHCDSILKESTEIAGFTEAIEFSMVMMCKYEIFSGYSAKDIFLSILRLTDLEDATIYDYCYTHFSAGLSFQNGFRIFPGIHVGTLRPKKVSGTGLKTHTYLFCTSKLELHWTKYFDKETRNITHKIISIKRKPTLSTKRPADAPVSVVVVREEPFGFQNKYGGGWSGLTVDIVKKAFEIMTKKRGVLIKYHMYATKKNEYGSLNKENKTWTGAMGELQSGRADVAIGMISKTKERKHYFAFTPAFEYVGITYMALKEEHPGSMFGFLKPFDSNLWWGMFVVFILSAVFIRILDYWNPFYDAVPEENRFDINESIWYSFGVSSGAGGGDFAPMMYPTRVFTVFYWFFALIITASYTGNLASFLTEKYEILPTLTLSKLPFKKDYEFGTLKGSFMESYIRSMPGNYKALAANLKYVDSYKHGVERVEDGKFAFVGNNLLLKNYEAKDPSCSIAVSPEVEAYTELAFPINRKWPLRRDFVNAVVQMRADGSIADILKAWLRYETECINEEAEEEEEHTSLALKNFYGLYIVLAICIAISFVVLFIKLGYLKCVERNHGTPSADPETLRMNDKEVPPDSDDKETDV
ncbi:uncharacterized protein LOC135494834 isoform X2 [Lineus longissimus]|uniref:uncharacterized protein LOC135494834 isoform X2 n=1 Tax=Lineus longissimus TaxID=88925 RepID=UPI002B4D94A3